MNFDLADTPTLQAVATTDQKLLFQDLQKRVAEALEQANAQPEVVDAADAFRFSEAQSALLQKAARSLNQHARTMNNEIAAATEAALDGLIQSSSQGETDYTASADLAMLEHRSRIAGRALQRLVEHLTPLAHVAQMRAESHALATRARALEHVAHERAEKVLSQIRDAVTAEMVLPVDMSKGVSGTLLARAAEMKRRSVEVSIEADRLEKWYMDNSGKER